MTFCVTGPASDGGDFVPDAVIDRLHLLGPPDAHVAHLAVLCEVGVDRFAIYLQPDAKESALAAYGETIIAVLSGPRLTRDRTIPFEPPPATSPTRTGASMIS